MMQATEKTGLSLPRRLPDQPLPMSLPVRLKTAMSAEHRAATAISQTLNALHGTTLLPAA